jgi:hypothetical protein
MVMMISSTPLAPLWPATCPAADPPRRIPFVVPGLGAECVRECPRNSSQDWLFVGSIAKRYPRPTDRVSWTCKRLTCAFVSGAEGTRTPDPLHAMEDRRNF